MQIILYLHSNNYSKAGICISHKKQTKVNVEKINNVVFIMHLQHSIGIVSHSYLYTNNQGDTKQYIPEKIDEDTPLLMTSEKYKVSFAPVSESENVKDSAFSGL